MATLLLIVIYLSFIGLGIPDSLFGAAWPAIYPDLGIDLSLASVYSVLSSVFSTLSSLLSDRIIARFGTGRRSAAVCPQRQLLGAVPLHHSPGSGRRNGGYRAE